jgi:exodeoxyribonuclease-3
MSMKVASWNVNSLKVRLPQVLEWLQEKSPDVLCLQETKLTDEKFPVAELAEAGYHALYHGQPTYNGVAIISRSVPEDGRCDWPDESDGQARLCAGTFAGTRVVNVYVPNGQSLESDKYPYKLQWLERLRALIATELQQWPRLLLLGDFNIAPDDRDVYDPVAWGEDVLCSPPERAALTALLNLGLQDSWRHQHGDLQEWSWWDYRAAGFRRNRGLRIDLILASNALMAEVQDVAIDRNARAAERPSDHAPVLIQLQEE